MGWGVASEKKGMVAKLSRLLSSGCQYIPTHPMAGSERSGWEAAHAELFQGAVTVVCDDFCPDPNAAAVMRSFWERLGSTTITLDLITPAPLAAAVSHPPPRPPVPLVPDCARP